ncbi:MAG: hypothetical protein M3P04_10290 [Actinomycetota bacterium]|nr:hypothetical protein [Actinomycetota bacterium]
MRIARTKGAAVGIVIFVLILLLLVMALVLPAVRVARRPLQPLTRALAALMVFMALTLLVFLFIEDDYTSDGRSNWTVYDVEYPAIPTIVGLVAGASWLVRREGTRAVALAAPLLAMGSGFAAFVCFLFTTN